MGSRHGRQTVFDALPLFRPSPRKSQVGSPRAPITPSAGSLVSSARVLRRWLERMVVDAWYDYRVRGGELNVNLFVCNSSVKHRRAWWSAEVTRREGKRKRRGVSVVVSFIKIIDILFHMCAHANCVSFLSFFHFVGFFLPLTTRSLLGNSKGLCGQGGNEGRGGNAGDTGLT